MPALRKLRVPIFLGSFVFLSGVAFFNRTSILPDFQEERRAMFAGSEDNHILLKKECKDMNVTYRG